MKKIILLIIAVLIIKKVSAHELMENRATLILRDHTHISATLYINYDAALYRVLMPNKPYSEFLLLYAGLKPAEFEQALLQAQEKLQGAIKILTETDNELTSSAWNWPNAAEVQKSIRAQAMRLMVDPEGHIHNQISEIHTDIVAAQKIDSVKIQFPPEFDKVLVVSYQPNQVWVEANSPAKAIVF